MLVLSSRTLCPRRGFFCLVRDALLVPVNTDVLLCKGISVRDSITVTVEVNEDM